jgi:acyl carrier protein
MSDIKKLFEQVVNTISEKTGVEKREIKPESFFMDDLNIDELELAEIVAEIEEMLEIELDLDDVEELKSVGDLLHAVQEATE